MQQSVDALQRALANNVFHYAKDSKKAAGRALGTLVEIVTFYLLKTWEYENHIVIERRLPEYGNPEITHNVEFSLHPSRGSFKVAFDQAHLPITSRKILKHVDASLWPNSEPKSTTLLSTKKILRNACALYEDDNILLIGHLSKRTQTKYQVTINQLMPHPFAIIECKRVGVEEGTKKGPQTIEKAKQGAYVARTISSLQKIRMSDGSVYGVLNSNGKGILCKPYATFLKKIIQSSNPILLRDFTLTIGVVSNHGNWFTSDNHNKELKVLTQSYDWTLFLTDEGLSKFVDSLLLRPSKRYLPVREAFIQSYQKTNPGNIFTKVNIAHDADAALQQYFTRNLRKIENWFNVISPFDRSIEQLNRELMKLSSKNWEKILG